MFTMIILENQGKDGRGERNCVDTFWINVVFLFAMAIDRNSVIKEAQKLASKGQFNKAIPMKVTYHDPCNLGRLAEPWIHWEPHYELPNKAIGKVWRRGEKGVYDQPRNILKAIKGIELLEMDRNRDNAWCCGYGGGVGVHSCERRKGNHCFISPLL
jgi:hypothetical protein